MTTPRTPGRAHRRRGRMLGIAAAVAASALALAGCSGDGSTSAAPSGKATLTYWTWATNIQDVVDIWNKANPDIQVKAEHVAEGDDLVTKIVTAAKAGNLPDLMQVEYQSLPTLVSSDVALDVTKDLGSLKEDFPASAWNQVTWSGNTYALPGDVAPLLMYVRTDLFQQYGLPVPTTWDQYRQEAATVHAADPSVAITSFDTTYPGWFAGLSSQAGASWWSTSGDEWKVDIDDSETQKVATYWGDLVSNGLVSTAATYSADWNSGIAQGKILSWIAPAWGADVLEGTAPDTAGKWQAVQIPQGSADEHASGYWGGSAVAVSKSSKNTAAAEKFATWLTTDTTALHALVDKSGLYPAATAGQEYATTTTAPAILGTQSDFWQLASDATQKAAPIQWSPNVNFTFSTMKDAFSTAITNKKPLVDTLGDIESASVKDLKSQGYSVSQ